MRFADMGTIISVGATLLIFFLIVKTFLNPFIAWRCRRDDRSLEQSALQTIERLRPFVFIKLFASCLTIPFFPIYLAHVAGPTAHAVFFASFAFSLYQIVFVLALIPSGRLVEIKSLKGLLYVTTALEIFVLGGFFLAQKMIFILVLQVVFGCLVPLSSAAEYAYVFNLSSLKDRNYAVALYANTIKAASVAGILSGGFLADRMDVRLIFLVAASLVLVAIIYLFFNVPSIKIHNKRIQNARAGQIGFLFLFKNMRFFHYDLDFFKTIFCVGLSLGVLEEGIVLFSIPLLCVYYHMTNTHIGQLLVLFSLGFFITNKMVARQADKKQIEKRFMKIGLMGITITLFLFLGFGHLSSMPRLIWLAVILLSLGMFRGFLVSPVVAYVSKHPITTTVGQNVSLSMYRLCETFGRIIGPLLLGYLFSQWKNARAVFFIAGLGLLFLFIFFCMRIIKPQEITHNEI